MGENQVLQIDAHNLGARIREAREGRGWTQQQLADRLEMSRTTVVAIEKGERRLKPSEIVQISSLLERSVSDLAQQGPPSVGFSAQLRNCLPPQSIIPDLPPQIEAFQRLCVDYVKLEELCQAPLRRRYPAEYDIQGVEPAIAAEDVASSERRRLDLGEGPLVRLREILEGDVGIRIFQIKMPPQVAGLFAFTEPLGACIAINLHHSPERRRISLAHEYGHLLTARNQMEITMEARFERRPAAERFAEAFARSFLIPTSGIRRRFLALERERTQGVTHGDLRRLALFYSVSMEVMTRRLEELRLVPSGTLARLRLERFNNREAQRHLRLSSAPSDDEIFSSRYVALAVEAWQREDLSEGQLARFLRTDRLGAREKVRSWAPPTQNGNDDRESMDLGAPLFGAGSR